MRRGWSGGQREYWMIGILGKIDKIDLWGEQICVKEDKRSMGGFGGDYCERQMARRSGTSDDEVVGHSGQI